MKIITVLLLAFMLSFSVTASPEKGQEYYLKYMRPFLKYNGKDFANKYLQVEWRRMFKKDGAKFIKKFSKKFPDAKEFLNGPKFKKIMPHIRDFAVHYASDSGNMPACN